MIYKYIYLHLVTLHHSFPKTPVVNFFCEKNGPLFFQLKKMGPKKLLRVLAMSKPLRWSDPKAPKSRPVVELRKKSRPCYRCRFWSLSDDQPKRRWG